MVQNGPKAMVQRQKVVSETRDKVAYRQNLYI